MGLVLIAAGASEKPPAPKPVPRKTGNLSVIYRLSLIKGQNPDPLDTMLRDPSALAKMGMTSVEDYVTFDVLQPVKGQTNFAPFLANATTCRKLGIGYAIYPWVHFYPDWVEQERGFTPYTNLEDQSTCRQPSGWAPHTQKLVRRFYRVMASQLGTYVDAVYVTDCADYGELGYPGGYTKWLREDDNSKTGWWCGDRYARRDFRKEQLKKYKTLAAVNDGWGTSFTSDDNITYPPLELLKHNEDPRQLTPQQRRWILDFVYWYQDASAKRVGDFIKIAQSIFRNKPCEIKLGHADEAAIKGHSYSSACRILKGTPRLSIRSTHAAVSYFHVKRVATAARFYGFDGFLTEPPGTVKPEQMASRIFTDACCGVSEYFDYPQNPPAAGEAYTKNIGLLDGIPALVDVALFFPEADHYLRIDQNYPQDVLQCANPMRDIADYDVVDERLIADGILENYAILIVTGNPMIETSTSEQMCKAVNRTPPITIVRIIKQQLSVDKFLCVDGQEREIGSKNGKGPTVQCVIGDFGSPPVMQAIAKVYLQVLAKRGLSDDEIQILTAFDGVLTGRFEHRILAYNSAAESRTVAGIEIAPLNIIEIKRRK